MCTCERLSECEGSDSEYCLCLCVCVCVCVVVGVGVRVTINQAFLSFTLSFKSDSYCFISDGFQNSQSQCLLFKIITFCNEEKDKYCRTN